MLSSSVLDTEFQSSDAPNTRRIICGYDCGGRWIGWNAVSFSCEKAVTVETCVDGGESVACGVSEKPSGVGLLSSDAMRSWLEIEGAVILRTCSFCQDGRNFRVEGVCTVFVCAGMLTH